MRRTDSLATVALAVLLATPVFAEFNSNSGVLPAGTELGDEALDQPREVFRSQAAGGKKSYLVNLGDIAFSSPTILGGVAQRAGISCNTCHVNGAGNPRLYVPGHSTRAGNFDTTGALFNPRADDGVLNPLTTPSLRGAHLLAPYGHDGRTLSLRDFARNVIVQEFSGPEPAPEILDAIVLYIDDIDFVPNRRLGTGGKITGPMSNAEKRGAALFYRPFAHDPSLSCAGCHIPSGTFVDHRQHDVGSGGSFKTPTLLNANFNAPYFHDGRYNNYSEVVAHFDRIFYLGLSGQDREDLVAYLEAIGDGEQTIVADTIDRYMQELTDFMSVLDVALPAHNATVTQLTVDTVVRELRELTEQFPERKDSAVSGGVIERATARGALKELVLNLHAIEVAAHDKNFDDAIAALAKYRAKMAMTVPLLTAAEPWSLFNREVHDAHFAAMRQLTRAAFDSTQVAHRRIDND